jgi:hypothetical protein
MLIRNRTYLATCGEHGHLINWIITCVFHLTSDLLIFALPLYFLRGLQIDWKRKLGLHVTFFIAIISIAAGLARFLIVLLAYPVVPTSNIEFLGGIDSYTGTIVACIPSLRPYINMKPLRPRHDPWSDDYHAQDSAECLRQQAV